MEARWRPTQQEIGNIQKGQSLPSLRNGKIRVLTQNLWGHYYTFAPAKGERLANFLKQLDSFDIILIQELFSLRLFGLSLSGLKQWVIGEAQKQGFLFYSDTAPGGFGQDAGVLILSRFPILSSDYIVFPEYGPPNSSFRWLLELSPAVHSAKGAVHAKVEITEDYILHLVNVHLDAHSSEERLKQVKTIVDCVKQIKDQEEEEKDKDKEKEKEKEEKEEKKTWRVIFGGDWNMTPRSSEYKKLVKIMKEELGCKSVFEEPYPITFPASRATLDHFFVNDNIEWNKEDRKVEDEMGYVSDHVGLSFMINILQEEKEGIEEEEKIGERIEEQIEEDQTEEKKGKERTDS